MNVLDLPNNTYHTRNVFVGVLLQRRWERLQLASLLNRTILESCYVGSPDSLNRHELASKIVVCRLWQDSRRPAPKFRRIGGSFGAFFNYQGVRTIVQETLPRW